MKRLAWAIALLIASLSIATNERCKDLFSRLLQVNEALKERHPEIVDLVIRPAKKYDPDWNGQLDAIARLSDGTEKQIAYMLYHVKDGVLNVGTTVKDGYRSAGVNHTFLLQLLHNTPSIKKVPADLMDLNLANFVVAMTSEGTTEEVRRLGQLCEKNAQFLTQNEKLFIDEFRALKQKRSVERFRKRLVNAFVEHTPAGRTRIEAGFARIESINIIVRSDGDMDVHVDISRGEAPPLSDIKINITDLAAEANRRYVELLPNGSIRRTSTPPSTGD
jgi:hypothetical protein